MSGGMVVGVGVEVGKGRKEARHSHGRTKSPVRRGGGALDLHARLRSLELQL